MQNVRHYITLFILISVTLFSACSTQQSQRMSPQQRTILLDKFNHEFAHSSLTVGSTRYSVLLNQATYHWFSKGTTLSPQSKEQLRYIAKIVMSVGYSHISVGGHSDNVGGLLSNEQKSAKWAKTVYNYLHNLGIASSKISYKGHGEFEPLTSNFTDAGRRENRRVEIVIS